MNEIILELIRQKRNILIFMLFLLVAAIFCYVLETGYLRPAINVANHRLEKLQQQRKSEGALDIPSLYRKGRADLKTLSGRIPVKRQFPRILGDIIDTAASNSLYVGKASYKQQTAKDENQQDENIISYSLSMSVQGGYAAVKSFLVDLQGKHDLIVIEQVSFSNDDFYEESVTMNLNLNIYLKNKEGL